MAYERLRRKKARSMPRPMSRTGLQEVQRPQRQAMNNMSQPTSRTTTSTLPEQEQGGGGVFTGMLAGKEAVDTIGESFKTGEKAQKGLLALPDRLEGAYNSASDMASNAMTGMNDFMTGTNTLTDLNQLPDNGRELMNMMGADRVNEMMGPTNFAPGSAVVDWNQMGTPVSNPLEVVSPTSTPIDDALLQGGTTFDDAGQAVTGMQTTGGVDKLGAAGSALGVGLNVNDMVSNGLNFGNVTGALGSGILGAGALGLGAANAWNPVGWGLLAASAADQIFDIF